MAPLRRKAKDSEILISKRNQDFLFSGGTQNAAECMHDSLGRSKRLIGSVIIENTNFLDFWLNCVNIFRI